MRRQIKQGFIFLLAVFAVLVILSFATDAHNAIVNADSFFFLLSIVFFSLSITVWIFSWAILIKKKRVSTLKKVIVGWSSVYGALTPIQIGADALRSIHLKDLFNVSFTRSISASMLVKGIKFLVLTILATVLISSLLLSANHDYLSVFGLASGLVVMAAAVLLFLLPLNRACGKAIPRIFKKLSKKIFFLKPLEEYFRQYASFLHKTSKAMFLLTFCLAVTSLVLELVSLQFAFYAMGIKIPTVNVVILFVLVSVLERTPILPRGIGLVEIASFTYLSFQSASFSISAAEIGSVIIIFDLARLVFPTIISIIFYLLFLNSREAGENIKPEKTVY